ncbi:MAG: DUF1223 domain-containing protein [Rhodospirillaceae bacterium]
MKPIQRPSPLTIGLLATLLLAGLVQDTSLRQALAQSAPNDAALAAERAPTVIELFTSQGCHSCPPADELLAALGERSDIVALSFHVTYWDRLGWKDPYGSEWGTNRQRSYAGRLGLSYVYTPQMVIDGHIDAVGSRLSDVDRALQRSQSAAANRLRISVEEDEAAKSLVVSIPGLVSAPPPGTRLLLLSLDKSRKNAVPRGENAGKNLHHAHVVRDVTDLGAWDGAAKAFSVPVPLPIPTNADDRSVERLFAVLAQPIASNGIPGPILGAGLTKPNS